MVERLHSSASETFVPEVQETITHKLQKFIEGVESFAEHTSEMINHKIEHFREKSRVFDLLVDIIVVNVANYEVLRALVVAVYDKVEFLDLRGALLFLGTLDHIL